MKPRIKRSLKYMAGPYPVFWVLPYFMVLIISGTVEQKYIGLYDAVQTYIYAPIIWLGFIPLPGGGIILVILFISLLLNFLFSHEWKIKNLGILLTHFGMLLLLTGGGITYISKEQGFLIFKEGESTNSFYDYHQRVLKITHKDQTQVINFDQISPNQTIDIPARNLRLKVIETCTNCDVVPIELNNKRKGIARQVKLKPLASRVNREENFSGITFQVLDNKQEILGTYIALEDLKEFPIVEGVEIKLQRAETKLPFLLTLNDFRKIDYAASMQAKSYESDVIISDGVSDWSYTIKMNKPLRHDGYTLYQSSFDQTREAELSVLSVVKDKGRVFPYISSLIIAFGLLLHCIIRLKQNARRAT